MKQTEAGNVRPRRRANVPAIALMVLSVVLLAIGFARATAAGDREAGGQSDEGRGAAGSGTASGRPADAGTSAADLMRRLTSIGGEPVPGGRVVDVPLPSHHQNQEPPSLTAEFSTDFSRALISYDDVVAGGPPKDGIPAIDAPRHVTVPEASSWLEASEPVIVVRAGEATHIYPLQILMWHEIANDTVGGVSLAVTYCPLCNTGIVFRRTFDDRDLDFGVSGRLVYSNMIMYDRQTESWWIQATGRGIAGRYAGQQLALYPSLMLSWADAAAAYPDARVLSRETGFRRDYGRNPYVGYDGAALPFLYYGPDVIDASSEHAMTRVLSVYHGDGVAAVAFPELQEQRVITRTLDSTPVVVFWEPGTASALDGPRLAEGRDVGTANAFYPRVDGRALDFAFRDGQIRDRQTGSSWSVAGRAVDGPLAGRGLEPALSVHHFLFSWRAFHPGWE